MIQVWGCDKRAKYSLIYRKFGLELLLNSSSLCYLMSFVSGTGDLSTSKETEVKKYTKRNILEQRKTRPHRQSHPRSIAAH